VGLGERVLRRFTRANVLGFEEGSRDKAARKKRGRKTIFFSRPLRAGLIYAALGAEFFWLGEIARRKVHCAWREGFGEKRREVPRRKRRSLGMTIS
jgi:hypothetical protein